MKRIIVVDDDPGIQDTLEMIFSRAGYEVTVFSGADPVLSGNYERPDAFILDKQLSGADGLDFCRFLKSQESTRHIPIIMLSANMYISRLAKEAGANDFVEKPFQLRELLATVKKYIYPTSEGVH
jgi:DNA-binding response OmpR family regulator